MTQTSRPAAWAMLPRELRDIVLEKLIARRRGQGGGEGERLAPRRADRSLPVPVSLEQAFVLKQRHRSGGRAAWTIAAPPVILDQADEAAVQRAIAKLARRHDVLHMTIREEGDRFVQVLDPDAPPPLTLTRLPLGAALRDPEGWIRRRYDAVLARPFDPEAGPLWRAEFVGRAGRGVILMTFCSLIADGESLYLIEADLRTLYAAELSGAGADAAPPAFDYADYAVTQDALVRAGRLDRAFAWWSRRLAGGPPRGAGHKRDGAHPARLYEQALGPETGAALDTYAAAHRTTPHVVLLAELMALLHRLDGEDDVWVASATAARHLPGMEATVGTFARLVPLRFSWPAEGDPLDGVGAMLLEAMDQDPVPHVLIEEMLEATHPGAPSPFRYIFNHRHVEASGEETGAGAGDVAFREGPSHAEAPREEYILLMVLQSGERRRLHWYLRTDRFDPAAARRLLAQFQDGLLRRLGAGLLDAA